MSAASPALVGDLLLHHAQLGRGDVGPSGPGQDGVQLLLLLLHGRLLTRRRPAVRRRGGGAAPPPLVPLIAAAAPAVVPITVTIPVGEEGRAMKASGRLKLLGKHFFA